jgi:pyruvyltransferase
MAFAHARILCVRGSLTARRAALRDTVVLGDAGLLSPALLPHRPQAHTRIGIVPHYKDKALPSIRALAERGDTDIHVIDVQDEPRKVLAAIAECEVVLSSSLHGLIAGDAFGRSTAWLTLSDQVLGDGFKFKDYASSIGVTVQPARISGTESTDQLAALASHKEYNRAAVHRRLESVFARL